MGTFPFGKPITPVRQIDRSPKRVFVLGVYASAVHARWIDENGKTVKSALAVASEPEIFWRGDPGEAARIIADIQLPKGAGRLVPASQIGVPKLSHNRRLGPLPPKSRNPACL